MMKLVRVQSVRPIEGFVVLVEFTDGTKRGIDLEPFLHGKIFEPLLKDKQAFRTLKVDERMGTLIWDNGADIDPDVLCHDLKPAWTEEPEMELAK